MAKVIVTGGAGFIGGHVARRLIADGHEVVVIDSLMESDVSRIPREAAFKQFDIRSSMLSDFDGVEAIFHLAAVSRTTPAVMDPENCVSVNVMGTARLLEMAREAGIKRFIFSSSNVVYAANTAYKMSKLAGEMLCDTYSEMYGVSAVKLRYSNVYGSGMREGDLAVFASLRDCCLKNKYVEITGDGNQSRDFTHVSDIVEANLLAWRSDYVGEALDVCTGTNHKMNDVAPRFKCEVRHTPDRKGDVKHIHQNPTKIHKILGWTPKMRFEDGFESIWNTSHAA